MPEKIEPILDAKQISRALTRIAHEILEQNAGAESLAIIGILTRGAHLAKRLHAALGDRSRDPSESILMYLFFKALAGTLAWLTAIPVLGFIAITRFGSVHPIGFPHF